jgi:hypothetical protein
MKNIFLLSLLCLTVSGVFAQTDLIGSFNSTHSGRSAVLSVSKTFNFKNEFGVGLRYNINTASQPDDQNHVYYKRLYASNFGQHLGFQAFYNRYVFDQWEHVRPFVFYDLQLAYADARNISENGTHIHGPYTWLEQCVGIGLKVPLSGKVHLYQKIGGGASMMFGEGLNATGDVTMDWEFGGIIQVGLVYRLGE